MKYFFVLACLGLLTLNVLAQKEGPSGRALIRTDLFTIREAKDHEAWVYELAGTGKKMEIKAPHFEIDKRTIKATVSRFCPERVHLLRNGGNEQSFTGVLTDDTAITLSLVFRWATDNPVVRFKYSLSDKGNHHFTKSSGKDELTYFSFNLSGFKDVKEIRLSDFNEKVHATNLAEFPLDERFFADGYAAMGPMLEARDGQNAFLFAYEHGSQFPDRFLEFRFSSDRSVSLCAVKGNYLDGQSLQQPDGDSYSTIWFEMAGVPGGEAALASDYRAFVLNYITENAESRKPYIFYNTWGRQERTKWEGGKYLSSMNLATTLNEIEVAHRMGVEVYVLDAGWFLKTGDWEVNTQLFPDTLRQIKAELDRYGMKLGLWFNPTVASLSSEMLNRNKANRLQHEGSTDQPFPVWETENSVRLDLVSPYWKDLADRLIQLTHELGVAYFKWDAVGQYGCDGPGHFHGTDHNSRQERADSYAFQLPVYMSKVIDRVCAAAPGSIFDLDITEPGRSVGLGFLSSGKYFIMNNGPYFDNYDIAAPGRTPLSNGNVNIFVNPGAARGWFTRSILTYDKWIPSILFLTHYQPDEPRNSQLINIASLILGQNGIWGEILKTSPGGVAFFHDLLSRYKQVRADITVSDPVRTGEPGSSPEIIEKLNGSNGRGAVVMFANAAGEYTYITQHAVDRMVWHTEGVEVNFDALGRAVIRAKFQGSSAGIVFFGTKTEVQQSSLSARGLRLHVDPLKGGRVVSLQWKGKEFLTQAAVEPTYFGATLWPDPQSAWWPVDPALDSDPYTVLENGRYRLHLISAVGKKGLQMEKLFILHPADTSVEIVYTLHNSSDSLRWAGPWELIRSNGGLSFFPGGPHQPLPASDLAGLADKRGIRWYLFDSSQVHDAQKLFSGSSEGWLAHCTGNLLFIKSYPQVNPGEIAPGQGQVELYTNPAATYVELETHGKYTKLRPGTSTSYRVVWWLRDLPAGMEPAPGNIRLARYVRRFVNEHENKP